MENATKERQMELKGYKVEVKIYESLRTIIYRGCREIDKQKVIIKYADEEYIEDNVTNRQGSEFEINNRIQSDYIVRLLDKQISQNRQALIFEDFGGEALKSILRRGKVTIEDSIDIGIKVAIGLEEIHKENIIHMDINPNNIIMNQQTKEVKIADFGNAIVGTKEKTTHVGNRVQGTIYYISPEQTGRTKRGIDYRTDFYALGVTLYEILVGHPPFTGEDELEIIHCHLAKEPKAPHEIYKEIPSQLSKIVMKLIEKMPENRYMSAIGIRKDLERCQAEYSEKGEIATFQLGEFDYSDQFEIPKKLYGRESEIRYMKDAFSRIRNGEKELLLIRGYSGTGKSALVNELAKSVTFANGFFIQGKVDQIKRNIPYTSIVQAIDDFIEQLLTENAENIDRYKKRMLQNMKSNSQIMIDLIPKLELIIGKQPEIKEVSPAEAKYRFQIVAMGLLKAILPKDRPVVMFLDDLQWVDFPTVQLLQIILTDESIHNLFIIGAYRDNEIDPTHPLSKMVETLQEQSIVVDQVDVKPLSEDSTIHMLSDILKCETQKVISLSEVCNKKTGGNPFFLHQFLTMLYEDGEIWFDWEATKWKWSIEKIENAKITDNVVDLLVTKARKLTKNEQKVLMYSACIGNKFDLKTLLATVKLEKNEVEKILQNIIKKDLVVGLAKEEYAFIHDRVQQAAYSMLNEKEKRQVHYTIATYITHHIDGTEKEEKTYDIATHFIESIALLTEEKEKKDAILYIIQAGKKAKAAAAYKAFYEFISVAIDMLDEDIWQCNYKFAVETYADAAEAAFLVGAYDIMSGFIATIHRNAKTIYDEIKAYEVEIRSLSARGEIMESLHLGSKVLGKLGSNLPVKPNRATLLMRLMLLMRHLGKKDEEELIHLKKMTNEEKLAIERMYLVVRHTAYSSAPDMFAMLCISYADMSVKYGWSEFTPLAFTALGLVLCGIGRIEDGYKYANVGIQLIEKNDLRDSLAKPYLGYEGFVRHWKEPLKNTLKPLLLAHHSGVNNGDIDFSAHDGSVYCYHGFFAGKELNNLAEEITAISNTIRRFKVKRPLSLCLLNLQIVKNLLGESLEIGQLKGESFDEDSFLASEITTDKGMMNVLYMSKGMLYYMADEYEKACTNFAMAEEYIDGSIASEYIPQFHYRYALAQLATDSPNIQAAQKHIRKFHRWSKKSRANYEHKYQLMMAELMRCKGNEAEAILHYDKAIEGAARNRYTQEEALAYELAAKFYHKNGRTKIALVYGKDALRSYRRWGAESKIILLKRHYPEIFKEKKVDILSQTATHTQTTTSQNAGMQVDIHTIIKATQAISSEIKLDELLKKLIHILIESAGAQKAFFITQSEKGYFIRAEGSNKKERVDINEVEVPITGEKLPLRVLHYVARTKDSLILSDESDREKFEQDVYFKSNHCKSILCTPIMNKGKLIGILYMENNLIYGAFTQSRIEIINVVSAQLGISLENANLYGNMERLVQEKTKEIKNLLDHAGQGFLAFHRDLIVRDQYSEECEVIFGGAIAGRNILHILQKSLSKKQYELMKSALTKAVNTTDVFQRDLFLSFIPEEVSIRGRYVRVEHKLLDDFGELQLMFILTDITEKKQLQEAMENERKNLKMIIFAVTNAAETKKEIRKFENVIEREFSKRKIETKVVEEILTELYRIVHTYKGTFAQYGMHHTEKNLHHLEDEIQEIREQTQKVDMDKVQDFVENINTRKIVEKDKMVISKILGESFFSEADTVIISEEQLQELEEMIMEYIHIDDAKPLLKKLRKMRYKNMKEMIVSYSDYIQVLADKLEKAVEPLVVEGDNIYFDYKEYSDFIKSLLHIFKNQIDHGIEMPDEREELGKPTAGRITCKIIKGRKNQLQLEFVDDGFGIDGKKVAEKAITAGVLTKEEYAKLEEDKVQQLIFEDRLSTKEGVSTISGRGVGLSAVKMEVEKLGGSVKVASKQFEGTTITINIPLQEDMEWKE